MEEFKGAKAFLMIPPSISRDKDLLKYPKSIILMGEIISMLNVTGDFHMSNSTIANILDASTQSVSTWLTLLEKKGLIVREQITVPARNPKNPNSKRILGRQIKAGPNLVKLSLLGWSNTVGEGSKIQFNGVPKQTLHKDNNLIDQNNRSVNRSSSAKKEEDPVRESIYNQFFKLARMNDDWHGTSTNPTLDQIKQLRSLLYQCKPETLQDALLKFSDQMKADIPQQPFIYLIKMLRDGLKGEKEWEKQQ